MDSIKCWRIANLVLTFVWIAMIPVAIMTGWIYSIAFISAASIYANAASHLAAWRSDVPSEVEKKVLDEEEDS